MRRLRATRGLCVLTTAALAALLLSGTAVPSVAVAATGEVEPDLTVTWGSPGDRPVVGDVDGDGRADFGRFGQDTSWRVALSSKGWSTQPGEFFLVPAFGLSHATPFLADAGGDGKADLITYHELDSCGCGGWMILHSTDSWGATATDPVTVGLDDGTYQAGGVEAHAAGAAGGTPAVADVDGDGKADLMTSYPNHDAAGTMRWKALLSSNDYEKSHPAMLGGMQSGESLAADADGDGVSDLASYSSATNTWQLARSTAGGPYQRVVYPVDYTGSPLYAYAPDIIKQDGTYFLFTCSTPYNGQGIDAIRRTMSTDLRNWTPPELVVYAHPSYSEDVRGNENIAYCDPSIVYWEGFYYLYNTNTIMSTYQSYITVSRSASLDGKFLTYTKRGTWEDNPPDAGRIVMPQRLNFPSDTGCGCGGYGAGTQSVIAKDGKLWMFWVDDSPNVDEKGDFIVERAFEGFYMMQSTDPVSWDPSTAVRAPLAVHSPAVKWDSERQRFVMVTIERPGAFYAHFEKTELVTRYSTDGVTWSDETLVIHQDDLPAYSHNAGVSSDRDGTLLVGETPFVAFGAPRDLTQYDTWTGWSDWGTRADIASSQPQPRLLRTIAGGTSPGDRPLVGDVTGDGTSDLTIFGPTDSSWTVAASEDDHSTEGRARAVFGAAEDTVMLADVDGDGRSDLTTYRASDLTWRIAYAISAFPETPLADLVIAQADVTISTSKGKTTINATVRNLGEATATSSVLRITDNGTPVADLMIEPIPPGGAATATTGWQIQGMNGERTIELTADAKHQIDELSELNNISTRVVTVRGNKVISS